MVVRRILTKGMIACSAVGLLAALSACASSANADRPPISPQAEPPSPDGLHDVRQVVMPTGPKAPFHVSHEEAGRPVLETLYKGPQSGVTAKVWVWLPPEYYQPAYAHSGFPVLMLYTGGSGVDYNFWAHQSVEPTQLTDVQLVKEGRAHPFIMVMPVLQLSKKLDGECSDVPGYPKMGTWMGEDLVSLVKANFRTLPGREGWGMAGASSGAYCATKLVMQYSRQFKAAAAWCAYFDPEPEAGPRWTAVQMKANSPTVMAQERPPDIDLLLIAGDRRRFKADKQRLTAFMQVVQPPMRVTTMIQHGGGHFTADLRKLLPQILEYLSANMEGPAPS